MTYPDGQSVYPPKIRDSSVVRKFISLNGRGYIAVNITDGTQSVDPVDGTLTLQLYRNTTMSGEDTDPRGELVLGVGQDGISRESAGWYYFDIGPEFTNQRSVLTAEWAYEVPDRGEFRFTDNLQIVDQMPFYESLRPEERVIIEQVNWLFGDMFDSTEGGPFLIENFQSHYTYERMANLLAHAITRMNYIGQPIRRYGVGPGSTMLPRAWQGLGVWALKLEIMRHLMRSYVEIPIFTNMTVTYTDRRDYLQRWGQILAEEKPDFEKAVIRMKRSELKLGRGALLVSGGIYSAGAKGMFMPGMFSAQVRAFRFYPAAPAISWGNIAGR
jgi:hypothetical protein